MTAQIPGSGLPSGGLNTTYSFIHDNGYEYMVSRPRDSEHPGDIMMGGGLVKCEEDGLLEYGTTDDTTIVPVVSAYLRNSTKMYFGENWGEDNENDRIRLEWTGMLQATHKSYDPRAK